MVLLHNIPAKMAFIIFSISLLFIRRRPGEMGCPLSDDNELDQF